MRHFLSDAGSLEPPKGHLAESENQFDAVIRDTMRCLAEEGYGDITEETVRQCLRQQHALEFMRSSLAVRHFRLSSE